MMLDRSFLHWPFFEERHRTLAAALEKWAARHCDNVDHRDVDAACRELVQKLGRDGWLRYTAPGDDPAEKIDVVLNGANLELFVPRPRDEELKRRLGLEGRFIVGYLGTVGLAHDLGNMVAAAPNWSRERQAEGTLAALARAVGGP